MTAWVSTLEDPGLTLDVAGGKGASLGRLTRAGFPVPPGFVVTTEAYRRVVAEYGLDEVIEAATRGLEDAEQSAAPAVAEAASARIRAAFAAARVPADVATEIDTAYRSLGGGPVAVRSSATAEDLPELSFAGQQDTYLNVVGPDALHVAVLDCWSSLFTARAISYRRRVGIPDGSVALAIVVQRLVPADAAGVLFTANPLTGHRGQMAIDATLGLGEALVSGQVEPDHIVADALTGAVLTRATGSKQVTTRTLEQGGVRTERRSGSTENPEGTCEETLTDEQVRQLVRLGARVAHDADAPQDIEWARQDGTLWLVQARPITSLYPVPDGAALESVWLSFGSVQGMLAPMSPLGRDAVRCVLSGAATFLGNSVEPTTNPYVRDAGERMWIRLDRALLNPLGRRLLPTALRFVDPSAGAVVADLRAEPGLALSAGAAGRHTVGTVATFARRVLPHLPLALLAPTVARDRLDDVVEGLVTEAARLQRAAASRPDPLARAAERAGAMANVLGRALPVLGPRLGPMIVPSVAGLRLLTSLVREPGDEGHGVAPLVMEVTRAVPRNVTTEMDLALWQVAQAVRSDPESLARFQCDTPEQLARAYAGAHLPRAAQAAVSAFLQQYGMRGVGEIDLGRPRWREAPAQVLATVQRYLSVPDDQAPPKVFARGEQAAAGAVSALVARAATHSPGRPRAAAVRFVASRVRALSGVRETPKFTLVRILGIAREALLASGADLVGAGVLDEPQDVFLLTLDELLRLPSNGTVGLRSSVARRRAARTAELRRRQVPRVLLGDGRAFFEGLGGDGGDHVITGSPVSPGVVESRVRVVHDPAHSELQPGEVMVCPGTDPAWTPLFLTAAGLVTEVGGMMTHGSVVAREYGIPAVVGVHEATTRLRTGQRIRLDGSAGIIQVLEPG
ncbi:MAG: PEP/pyruvate-binding domain-containing protein [Dermatophilaceae bacterium]